MRKTTKLRLLKVVETFCNSLWNSIALSIGLRIIIESTGNKIENTIMFLLGCLLAMLFIEVMFIRFKEVLKDTFYEDMDKAEEIEREIELLEKKKNNLK